jgi:DNA-binding PadR family transcriptional regulator
MTNKEREVAFLLGTLGPSTGWALAAASNGRIKRGTVYVLLGRMVDKGFLESEVGDRPAGQSGPPRRIYRLTALARRVLEAEAQLTAMLTEEPA